MENIMNLLNTAIIQCSTWFVNIFKSSGVVEIYFANLFIFLGVRFLLMPVFGPSSIGSDFARDSSKKNSNKGDSKNE